MKYLLILFLSLASVVVADEYMSMCCLGREDCNNFDEKITDLIKGGWSLSGNHTSSWVNSSGLLLCQALIKKDKPKSKPKMVKVYVVQCWEPGNDRVTNGLNGYVCDGWQPYGNMFEVYEWKQLCQMFVKEIFEKELNCSGVKK